MKMNRKERSSTRREVLMWCSGCDQFTPHFWAGRFYRCCDCNLGENQMDQKKMIVFSASWCSSCHTMDSILEDFEEACPDVELVTLDFDEHHQAAEKKNIVQLPTMIMYKGSKSVDRINGPAPLGRLLQAAERAE